ncbi:MAG: ABC transporter permease [Phycisphaerales bacterium]
MFRLIFWRLLQFPLILAVIFVVTLLLAWVVPGDPLSTDDGREVSPEIKAAMMRQYNLDRGPVYFGLSYLKGVALGTDRAWPDFGPSLTYQDERVSGIIGDSLPVSVMLGSAALAVALLIGTVSGVIGALRPGGLTDLSSLGVALIGISLPNFVTGSVLLFVFAGLFKLFPVGGWGSPMHIILPAVTLGIAPAAYIARLVRLGLADIMSSDYIRTARAKGLSRHTALFEHALKVAYLPVLSFMGPAAASIMTGSFVVEKLFNVPGMGEHFVNSVINKDQFLILGVVLTYSTMLVVFNLIVDVAYAWIDPRIELV